MKPFYNLPWKLHTSLHHTLSVEAVTNPFHFQGETFLHGWKSVIVITMTEEHMGGISVTCKKRIDK